MIVTWEHIIELGMNKSTVCSKATVARDRIQDVAQKSYQRSKKRSYFGIGFATFFVVCVLQLCQQTWPQ